MKRLCDILLILTSETNACLSNACTLHEQSYAKQRLHEQSYVSNACVSRLMLEGNREQPYSLFCLCRRRSRFSIWKPEET